MTENKIKLSLLGDMVFCFNADDYMKIRAEYRIGGRLIGSVVKWPRNTIHAGLPAIYSAYEAQMLIDKGVVQLRRKCFSNVPNETDDKAYEDHCEAQVNSYQAIYKEQRVDEARKKMHMILAGKRKKVAQAGGDPNEVTEETILNEIREKAICDIKRIPVQVPTADPFDADFEEITGVPNLEPFKYRVFCDLWEKGNWLTSAATFGGDFLVYPGESALFHASHIIHILSAVEAQSMSMRTFITRARLGVNVNKLCSFAYENPETKEICYQSVQWLGK